ncbi:hypothetical protein [Lacipirellula parvula]|uniref:Lipoprotein n=1 Tax=Lacipirellula parvula TaxID=2650471 RepID=A0A5K7XH32_9BACT|nr:hypothetical protein [Lacipirellula parvula]BBO33533.1 hypothetical protein PLANPX_3145 [Lacipirellula parvula]
MRHACSGWLALPLLAAIVPALAGCGEEPKVATYETPATEKFRTVFDVEEVRASTDHMLAAIIAEKATDPQKSQAWFFKLVARGEGLDPLRKSFDEFLATVKLSGDGKPPTWALPEGWTEKPASAMRAATIEIPFEGKTLELAVSSLPLTADWEEFRKINIDRWVGQLQQSRLSADEIAKLVKEKPTADDAVKATFIELIGVMQPMSGAMPGATGMPAGHPPVAGADAAATETADAEAPAGTAAAPSTPPVATQPPMQRPMPPMGSGGTPATEMPRPTEFTYAAPEGWKPGVMSSMRKAAFLVADGDRQAEITVMPFPNVQMMADPKAQAQRWSGEVGLQLSEQELEQAAKPTMIDGIEGHSFVLLGPEGEGALGTIAAMAKRGEQIWFFKMKGDRKLVEAQQEPFNKFIESIKFAGDGK